MPRKIRAIDIEDKPDLLEIAEGVVSSGEPLLLRRNAKEMAIVMPWLRPTSRSKKTRSRKDIEAFRSSVGSWAGIDIDEFLANNEASRQVSVRDRVQL